MAACHRLIACSRIMGQTEGQSVSRCCLTSACSRKAWPRCSTPSAICSGARTDWSLSRQACILSRSDAIPTLSVASSVAWQTASASAALPLSAALLSSLPRGRDINGAGDWVRQLSSRLPGARAFPSRFHDAAGVLRKPDSSKSCQLCKSLSVSHRSEHKLDGDCGKLDGDCGKVGSGSRGDSVLINGACLWCCSGNIDRGHVEAHAGTPDMVCRPCLTKCTFATGAATV